MNIRNVLTSRIKLSFIALLMYFNICIGTQVYEMMTDEEIHRVFRSTRDRVPAHELVEINSENIFPTNQFNRKISTESRYISFMAFGRHYNLHLKRRDEVLLGKNTPIWHVRTNPLNSSQVEYELLTNILDDVNGIYQDPMNMVSLLETKVQNSDKVVYDGMVAADLAISPLPQRFIDLIPNITDDRDNLKDHVIYKVSTEDQPSDDIPSEIDNSLRKSGQKFYRPYPLQVLYPEILVIIDDSLYKHLGNHPQFAMNYLVPFWNGVDLRYQLLDSPEVKLNIAGVILAQDQMALGFLDDNLDDIGRIHAKEALLDAGEYFNEEAEFITSKDVIVTMTKRDICSLKYADYCKSSALGKAFVGKACSKKQNTAILEDNGGYSGIITATHEIGHLLGLPHDGEKGAADCSMKEGFIMASAKHRSVNSLCWSPCSKKLLQQFASLTASNCLENKPKNLGELVFQNLPGKILTLDEQCLARGGIPCVFNATVCWKLHCTKSLTNMKCIGKAPAAEGTTCGDGLYCRNGECVDETFINDV